MPRGHDQRAWIEECAVIVSSMKPSRRSMLAPSRGSVCGGARLVVSEVKWRATPAEVQRLLAQLAARFERSPLARAHRDVRFEIIDASELPRLAPLQQ